MAFCAMEGLVCFSTCMFSMFMRICPFCFFSVMTRLEIQGPWSLGSTSLRLCMWALSFFGGPMRQVDRGFPLVGQSGLCGS